MSAVPEKAIIRMRGVSRRFRHGFAVKDLDLEVLAGETVALIGPSGSGKTTTLRMINRLIERTSGSVEVMGEDVSRSDPAELRRRIGYVIQDVGLFPHYSVRKNIGVVPELLGWKAARIEARTKELMQLVGLPFADFAERFPSQLSGGQRQRVGVARALAADPALILLDEPFGALDPLTREILQDEFLALCARVKKTFVLVTHDIFEAVRLANRIVVMHEGRVLQDSPPLELVQHPGHELVEAMLGRHRYQLELMTVNLEAALRSAEIPAPDHAIVVELPKEASVWDALTRLSKERASTVRVLTDGQPRYASRERLLEAVK